MKKTKNKLSKVEQEFELFWHDEYRHVNNIVKEIARRSWLNGAYKASEHQSITINKYFNTKY